MRKSVPPPRTILPVLERAKRAYALWIVVQRVMRRGERFGIGARMDTTLLEVLDTLREATYTQLEQKILLLARTTNKIDSFRFFLQISWENKLVSAVHFASLGELIEEMGRMVGGWRKELQKKTSAPSDAEES